MFGVSLLVHDALVVESHMSYHCWVVLIRCLALETVTFVFLRSTVLLRFRASKGTGGIFARTSAAMSETDR